MTLITKTDVENELQITLPVGYTECSINEMADAAEDYLKVYFHPEELPDVLEKYENYAVISNLTVSTGTIIKRTLCSLSFLFADLLFMIGIKLIEG